MKVSNCTSMSIDAIHNNYCQGPCRKGNCIQTCNTHISILEKLLVYRLIKFYWKNHIIVFLNRRFRYRQLGNPAW